VITRWTAHYLSLQRLLTVEKALKAAWIKYGDEMIASTGSKSDDNAKAIAVTTLIPNEHRQSSKSSVLVFKFEVLRRLRMPIARYCLSVELVRVRSSIDS
jgi:hypothetical protein